MSVAKVVLSTHGILILLLTVSMQTWSSSCIDNKVRLQVLGSGGPELDDGRVSSSYLIWVGQKARLMVDAGPGSSINFGRAGARFEHLDALLLTHLHVDHSADLPALIKGSFFTPRDNTLYIYGPDGNQAMPSTSDFVAKLLGKQSAFRYLSDYVQPTANSDYHIEAVNMPVTDRQISTVQLRKAITIHSIPVHHGPIAAVAWRVEVLNCVITFSGDMNNSEGTLAVLAKDSDILVAHNAVPETASGVAANLHMKPSSIGVIANQANVKKIVIAHRMKRTQGKEQETLRQIRKSYSGAVVFSDDLSQYPVGL